MPAPRHSPPDELSAPRSPLRRCLVLADGCYEWVQDRFGKQPVRVVLANRQPFALAGLWDKWTRPDCLEARTFAIITTQANELLRPISSRMPAILDHRTCTRWLDPGALRPNLLLPLLRPYQAECMA